MSMSVFLPAYFTVVGLVLIGGVRLYFWLLREPKAAPVPAPVFASAPVYVPAQRQYRRPTPEDTGEFPIRVAPYLPRSIHPHA
jgi:hypothetical protein